jgi:alpha-L-fucosidase
VTLLGGGQLAFRQDGAGLHFTMPHGIDFVPAVRIDGRGLV